VLGYGAAVPELRHECGLHRRACKEAGGLQRRNRVTTNYALASIGTSWRYIGRPNIRNREQIRSTQQDRLFSMNDFGWLKQADIPRLRRYAHALTRDAARADELVQSCLTRAVAKQHLWQAGTDLRAWLFTILHNQHVNDVRRSVREGISVEVETAAPLLTMAPNAHAVLELRDLGAAIDKLPLEQRQVILLVGLEGMRYDEVATILGVPVGTIRSRLSRGRDQLRKLMGIEDEDRLPTAIELPSAHRPAA